MDATTLWVNAADIFTSVATFGALVAVIFEIKNTRNAEKRSAAFELHDKFQQLGPDLEVLGRLSWEKMGDFYTKYPRGTKERTAHANVVNFFEVLGQGVFYGQLDKKTVITDWGQIVITWWRRVRPYVVPGRETFGLLLLANFEWLAFQSMKDSYLVGTKLLSELDTLRKEISM